MQLLEKKVELILEKDENGTFYTMYFSQFWFDQRAPLVDML